MHSMQTEVYRHPVTGKRCRWALLHNNESHRESPVHIVLIEIDGEHLKLGDPRVEETKVPFGVLAEFVGMRVQRDKINEIEQQPAEEFLGLHLGPRAVLD